MRHFSWIVFVQLMMEFVDHEARFFESLFACGCDSIHSSSAPGHIPQVRFEQATAFHSMQQRIQCSCSDPIAMTFEFFHHCQSKDRLVRGVDEHMDADESVKEFPMMC